MQRKKSRLFSFSALLSALLITGCQCDCKIDYKERPVQYQCDDDLSLMVTYINQNHRMDEPLAELNINQQRLMTELKVGGYGKNYYSPALDISAQMLLTKSVSDEIISSVQWNINGGQGELSVTTNKNSYQYQCFAQ